MTLRDAEERRRRLEEEIARIDAGGSSLEGSMPIPPDEYYDFKQPLDTILMVRLADAALQYHLSQPVWNPLLNHRRVIAMIR